MNCGSTINWEREARNVLLCFLFLYSYLFCRILQYLNDCYQNKINIKLAAAAAAKSLQMCLTLCNPIDGSPLSSPVPGILQARTLEWVAISFSNAWKWKVKSESEVAQSCSALRDPMDCSLPGSSIHGFSRQEYWSGVPLPSLIKLANKGQSNERCIFCHMKNITSKSNTLSFSAVKNLPAMQKTQELQVQSLDQEYTPHWQPTLVFLLGKFHAQRSLLGYNP